LFRSLAALEAGEPLARIVREVGLRQLAVVHAVDARLDLLLHHLGDAIRELHLQRLWLGRRALLLRGHRLTHPGRSWQAAGVRRKDATGAPLHPLPPSSESTPSPGYSRTRQTPAPLAPAPSGPEPKRTTSMGRTVRPMESPRRRRAASDARRAVAPCDPASY